MWRTKTRSRSVNVKTVSIFIIKVWKFYSLIFICIIFLFTGSRSGFKNCGHFLSLSGSICFPVHFALLAVIGGMMVHSLIMMTKMMMMTMVMMMFHSLQLLEGWWCTRCSRANRSASTSPLTANRYQQTEVCSCVSIKKNTFAILLQERARAKHWSLFSRSQSSSCSSSPSTCCSTSCSSQEECLHEGRSSWVGSNWEVTVCLNQM